MAVLEEEMVEVDVVVLVPGVLGSACGWGVGSIDGGRDGDGGTLRSTLLQAAIIELTSKASVRAFHSIDHWVAI